MLEELKKLKQKDIEKLALICSVTSLAVRKWMQRNSIPDWHVEKVSKFIKKVQVQ